MSRQTRYGSLYERLVTNTHEPEGAHSCWVWKGARGGSGYGRLNRRVDGNHKACDAHRVMGEVLLGRALQEQEQVDHLCYNTACVNPDHIEVVHYLVNLSRRRINPVQLTAVPLTAGPAVDPLQLAANDAWDCIGHPSLHCPF